MKKILTLFAIIFSTGYLLSFNENRGSTIKSSAPGQETSDTKPPDAIKQMKKEVKEKGSGRQNITSSLRNKLKAFKKRISPETKK